MNCPHGIPVGSQSCADCVASGWYRQQLWAKDLEVQTLRGVSCQIDNDDPCGACIKCASKGRLSPVFAQTLQGNIPQFNAGDLVLVMDRIYYELLHSMPEAPRMWKVRRVSIDENLEPVFSAEAETPIPENYMTLKGRVIAGKILFLS